MPTRYYVTPYDPVHWKDEESSGVESSLAIDFQDFSKAAQAAWPSYETYPNRAWSISIDDNKVSGSFRGKGNQILAMEITGYHFNQFIAWYRKYISSEHRLFLFAEESWNSLELTSGISGQDIGDFTGYK